jgi:hypothetical protein
LPGLIDHIRAGIAQNNNDRGYINEIIGRIPHAIEALVADGWIKASFDDQYEMRDLPERVANILHWNKDNAATA